MPLAPVTGKPQEPQGEERIRGNTGLPYNEEISPEANRVSVLVRPWDAWQGAEPIATGLSRYRENDKPVYGTDPNNRFGPVRRELSKEEEDRQSRQRMLAASEVLEGSSQVGMVAVPASAAATPIRTALGFGAGYLASEGAGKVVHGHVSPEAEELTRNVAFFLPSAVGVASGLKTGYGKGPGPRPTRIGEFSVFGDKVAGGFRITPEDVTVGARVGPVSAGKNFSRGFSYEDSSSVAENSPTSPGNAEPRQLGPGPEEITGTPHEPPSEAAKALMDFEQHAGNPDFQPAPAPPTPPGANGPEHLTPDVVKGVSDAIMQADPAKRPNLMTEAHGNMVKWMVGRGTFTGPDGKIHTVDSEGQAKKLASKFINDEVDRRDAEQEKAAKAQEETNNPTTTAPIAGKPPAAGNMTADTAAVQKVAAEANIHPEQKPAIAVKKEPPKETAALAQPPAPVDPKDVAAIGKEEPKSGRTVLQPSDDVMQNERLAAHAAPELATKLSHIAAGVDGATFDRIRPQKELERVDEKVDDAGKPPETVPDYLAAQIAADTPQAKDSLIRELKKNFNVIEVEDSFLEGREKLAGYPSANVQVMMGNGLTAEVQIVPREVQEIANQSHRFYTAGREAELRGDHEEHQKQFAEAQKLHDEAMDRFRERNGIEKPQKHEFSSTQINIDPQSELGRAHAQAVAAIPKEHVGKEGLEETPHVTIRYGLKDDSPAAIAKIKEAAAQIQPFEVPVGKTEVFPATEHSSFDHPVIARLETTSELKALRTAIEGAGAFKEDNFPEYKPHVTLGYIKPEFAQQYKGGNHLEGQTVPVREIVVSKRDGGQEVIPLGGGMQAGRSVPLDELEGLQAPTLKPVQASLGENEAPVVPQESQASKQPESHSTPLDELEAVDRRQNVAERKRVEHMTPEQRAHHLLTDEKTGLPNYRAFHEADTAAYPHVGYADLDDFKDFNSALGHVGVDKTVLPRVGEIIRAAAAKEDVQAFHRTGDEFLFRAKDEAVVGRVVESVNRQLAKETFKHGGKEKQGAGLSYGTGKDEAAAEHAADADKERRKKAGLRKGARDAGTLKPGESGEVNPKDLTFDPQRFQYKLNVNERGVTNLLTGQKWNPDLAGVVSVWRDPQDGKLYVINGHHRAQLAVERGVDRLLVRHVDVKTAAEARARGALQNIAEGRGTAVDAAKFFRESGIGPADLDKHGISLGEATAAKGLALSRLDPSIFEKVATGKMSEGRGIAIGEATADAAQQEAIVKLIDKREAQGKNVTEATVAELARFVGRSGSRTVEQGGLFGANQQIHSLAMEKAEISAYVKSQLSRERRIFGAVSSEDKAAALGRVKDQSINAAENKKISQEAGQAEEAYNRLSARSGPVNDALDKAARELASGYHKPEEIKQRTYGAIREEVRKAVSGGNGSGAEGLQKDAGRAEGDEEKPAFSLEKPAPTFFSKAEKVATEKLPNSMAEASVIPALKNAGVKGEEIKWMGLADWLAGKTLVTKKALLEFIRQNNVQVKEVMKGTPKRNEQTARIWDELAALVKNDDLGGYDSIGDAKRGAILAAKGEEGNDWSPETLAKAKEYLEAQGGPMGNPKFEQHVLPGGENYRELLLTLPEKQLAAPKVIPSPDHPGYFEVAGDSGLGYFADEAAAIRTYNKYSASPSTFRSNHFDEPNVLAHVRFNDRVAPDGSKTLFIEEVQSDWHQKGRKQGYATEISPSVVPNEGAHRDSHPWQVGDEVFRSRENAESRAAELARNAVPDAPFKSTWHELAMKRMLRYAAENGYDRLAWTTGEQQASRYGLSKQIDKVQYSPHDGALVAFKNGQEVISKQVAPEKLADFVDKEVAEKLLAGPPEKDVRTFDGEQLEVGGQGMKGFYDKILPYFMNKYGKKWGAKVGETQLPTSGLDRPVDDGAGGLVRGGKSGYKKEPVHSIDITPAMRDSVLYEGQPLFNLSKDELRDWAVAAGRRLKIEEMGDQGNIFGGNEKMYRLSTSKQNSVAVTQSQLDALTQAVPRVGIILGMEQPKREGVWFDYDAPEHSNLFSAGTPPTLTISREARDLINKTGGFRDRFNGANLSVQNARIIAARLAQEAESVEFGEIPKGQEEGAKRLAEALRKAADEAGNKGVTLLLEGSPEHVAHEESFHSAQRGLGEGDIRYHLPEEAVNRLIEHPAAKAMGAELKAMGYDDNLHPSYKIAEIAAKIATGQTPDTAQAADWFVKYVDELHQHHGEANVASAFSNLYDGARALYERAKAAKTGTLERPASGSETGIQSPIESLPERATGPPQEGRGIGTQENRSGKADQGQLDQPPLFSLDPKKTIAALYKQDIAPAIKGAAGGLKEVVTKGLRLVAPRVGVPSHLLDTIMRMKGEREEEMYRFQRTTEGMKKMFDKLPQEARIAFIDRMMHGQRQPSTELEDVADSIRAIQDRFREQEKIFKPNLTDKENYFHLKWTKLPQGVDEEGNLIEGTGGERPNTGQGNRPLQGGRSFMKRKTLPDASAGINRGGELLTTNPIGLLEHRVMESLKFTTARKMWEELKDTPYTVSERGRPMHMVQFFREGQGQQARALGYEQLNDRIAKVLFPAGSGEGMIHPGEYWVEQNAARLLNNFLSRDLIRESAFGRGVVGLKNATTAWRLAFSPFHTLTESIITTGSEIGRGIEHAFNQGVRGGSPAEIAKGIATAAKAPVAPFTAAREGGSAIRYVRNPEEFIRTVRGDSFLKKYPEAAELISDLFTGGAKLAMHEDFRMKMVESMRQAIADNNYIGALLRTPGALSQAIQYPLFEVYIPRLKLGMFMREYSEAMADRQPEIDAGKLTRAKLARETWDNIDYRFGEVNWDNFFFNRTFKTSLQLAFRAFAWRFGNFAFTGSGVTGQARQVAESLKFLKDAATGGESARPGTNAIPKLDPRMAKLLGLAIFGLIAHGLLQWALTREKPKDVKDLIAPRDGTVDNHGHPNRWTLPIVPYRDLESARANPGGYLRGGTADIWTAIPEAINNRDFRNHLVSHPDDPYWEQMFDKAAHVVGVPIGIDKFRQEKKHGEGTGNALLGELGLSRATNYELTPAEKKMREIQIAHYGPETDEDLEAREKKQDRIAAGHLTPEEMKRRISDSVKNNFEKGMRSFTYDQAKQVYDVASPEEKAMMGRMLLQKRFNKMRTSASVQ